MAFKNALERKKTGVLLVNLGSPDAPTKPAVRRYLREFLSDPRVVNIPRLIWWGILNFLVLPFRPGKSAKAYQKIWQKSGSPLVSISTLLGKKIAGKIDSHIDVEVAMRYGQPSMNSKLEALKSRDIRHLIVLPLYPQYSSTTTASVYDALTKLTGKWEQLPTLTFINEYHQNNTYIQMLADSIAEFWQRQSRGEILLMSFHGLPARSIELGDPYYYQCQTTAALIADKLSLEKDQWKIVFQSRFGKAEWLKPYCVQTLQQLPEQGIKNIDVVCPGFSVDCLETLEEIAMTNKAIFLKSGGHTFQYIPALNATRNHADALIHVINENLQGITLGSE